jgi:hypothetical protein
VALDPGELLTPVVAPLAADLGPLDRLAVDAAGTRRRLPAVGDAHPLAQGVHEPLPGAVVPPSREVVVDGALGRQVVGEHVPLAARAVEVEDRVEHLAHVDVAGPAEVEDGDVRLDQGPLVVGQVGGIGLTHRGMLRRRGNLRTS